MTSRIEQVRKAIYSSNDLPRWAVDPLEAYIVSGCFPGVWMKHVISGKLFEASLASAAHARDVGVIARFLATHCPECCGSDLHMHDWMNSGGLEGRFASESLP